ncbi:MAG: hypothetical protein FJY97_15525 [candidate division Zixibacteria bacterium]|nr:hypothetical protein [candidate division Zixibacteria bacterium]
MLDPKTREYILRIVMATHEESGGKRQRWFGRAEEESVGAKRHIDYGVSPRGAQTLTLAAKTMALLDDRPIATPEDVKEIVLPALRHRLILNFEAESAERNADDLLEQIVKKCEA